MRLSKPATISLGLLVAGLVIYGYEAIRVRGEAGGLTKSANPAFGIKGSVSGKKCVSLSMTGHIRFHADLFSQPLKTSTSLPFSLLLASKLKGIRI
jgi:hypothetical protein